MAELYNDDCLALMDRLIEQNIQVNSIITDPPYGMNFQSNYRGQKYNKIDNDNNLDWLNIFVEKSYQLASNNTAHYVFCSHHHIDIYKQAFAKCFTVKNILIWEKNNTSMGDLKGDFAPKYEMILFLQKGRRLINGKRDSNILKFSRTNNKYHPTEKPVDLMEYLIAKFTDENDTILDPYMGSGTTGVACKNLNRDFIGIEINKEYYQTAQRRIDGRN